MSDEDEDEVEGDTAEEIATDGVERDLLFPLFADAKKLELYS